MTEDRELVAQILNGDMEAFKLLIKSNERLVAHMVGRLIPDHHDREELCQDVFLKVYQKLSSFNFASKLSTWIATIAYRQSVNYLKKKRIPLKRTHIDDLEGDHKDYFVEHDTPESAFSSYHTREFLDQVIDQLPAHYKAVLTLYHLDEMSCSEISEITDMPEGTVKNYLFRARKLLKNELSKYIRKEEIL